MSAVLEGFNAEPGVPDFVAADLMGFRAWRLENNTTGILHSLARKHAWTEGKQESTCQENIGLWMWAAHATKEEREPCLFPTKDCAHGFYAFYDVDYYEPGGVYRPMIDGVVQGWGRTVTGSKGFRSEFAAIRAFVGPARLSNLWLNDSNLTELEGQALVRRLVEKAYPSTPWFGTVDELREVIPLLGRPVVSLPPEGISND